MRRPLLGKLFSTYRAKRDLPQDAKSRLYVIAQSVHPPTELFHRIEERLEREDVTSRHERRATSVLAITVVSALAVSCLWVWTAPPGFDFEDGMGVRQARIESRAEYRTFTAPRLIPSAHGAYHLWVIAPSGSVLHKAALDGRAKKLAHSAAGSRYAISFEKPGFFGSFPAGPIVLTSRPDNFFEKILHPFAAAPRLSDRNH